VTDLLEDLMLQLQPDRVVLLDGGARACRVCGCTQERACVDPEHGCCWWVEPDLCSHCGEPAIVAAEYDRLLAELSPEESAFQHRLLAWCTKARAALGRASRVDPAEFEI
jgi:hypothetical protein